MNLLYLTACKLYGPHLNEVNNTYRAIYAARHHGVVLGGPGFDVPLGYPIYLPEYARRRYPDCDCVFIADPWHVFWDSKYEYPNCPTIYTGIEDLDLPLIIESGDSQFYYEEIISLLTQWEKRSVCIRAMSHRWRFDPSEDGHVQNEVGPPESLDAPIFYLPHGAYDEMVEASRGRTKCLDVLFSGSEHAESYPARAKIAEALRSMNGIEVGWIPHPSSGHRVIGPAFWKLIASAKLAVAGTNAYKNLTMRYIEIPACGTMVIGDLPDPESDTEPWRDHIVNVGGKSTNEISELIRETLSSENLDRRTTRAREFILSRHKFSIHWSRVMDEIESWISANRK